jgi:hypothetical protein
MSSVAAIAAISASPTTRARNRNCPKCQGLARAQWVEDRQAEVLDVPYFHVVFTVPDLIATIAFQNQTVVYPTEARRSVNEVVDLRVQGARL